jgi:hypothetical protein
VQRLSVPVVSLAILPMEFPDSSSVPSFLPMREVAGEIRETCDALFC